MDSFEFRGKFTIISLIVTVLVSVLLLGAMITYAQNKTVIFDEEANLEIFSVEATFREKQDKDFNYEELELADAPIVVVDAYHGGASFGTRVGDMAEKDVVLQIAMKVKELSADKHYIVALTRDEDVFVDMPLRMKFARKAADYYIGLNLASNPDDVKQFGMQAYYNPDFYRDGLENVDFADAVLRNVVLATNDKALGLKTPGGDEMILKVLDMPAVMLDAGFISNAEEAALLAESEYIEKIARGIVEALDEVVE